MCLSKIYILYPIIIITITNLNCLKFKFNLYEIHYYTHNQSTVDNTTHAEILPTHLTGHVYICFSLTCLKLSTLFIYFKHFTPIGGGSLLQMPPSIIKTEGGTDIPATTSHCSLAPSIGAVLHKNVILT